MADHACPDCGAVHREKPTSLKQRVEMLEAKVEALEAKTMGMSPFTFTTSSPSYYLTTTGRDNADANI